MLHGLVINWSGFCGMLHGLVINWSGFCGMLHGLVINWSSSAIETSRNRVNVFSFITVFSLRLMMLGEVDRETLGLACGVLLICDVENPIMDEAIRRKSMYIQEADKNVLWDLRDRKCRSPIMWAEVGEGQLIGPELVQETTEKISDYCLLQSDGLGKGPVAYRLDLPEELNGVHDTFHVSNLKKCLADPTLQVPLDEIQVDIELNFGLKRAMEILGKEELRS
ncbi:hypothetical protein Tco_1235276 [Tanacetum coccineum]